MFDSGSSKSAAPKSWAFVAVASLAATLAHGHGYLAIPPARSVVAWQDGTFYNPSSGNGASYGPAPGDPGPCGDPFQVSNSDFLHQDWSRVGTYRRGGLLTTRIKLTTNHGGRFSMYICEGKTPEELTLDCFFQNALENTDTGTDRWWIQDPNQSGWEGTIQWKIPDDIRCGRGCVVMWEYAAMQMCLEKCKCTECGSYCEKEGFINPVYGARHLCDDPVQPAKLETFRNCADIVIRK